MSLIVTLIGEDRPGIVEGISELVLAAGANWEESRMARLAGKFAGILRVNVEPARSGQLASALTSLESQGLTVVVAPSSRVDRAALHAVGLELVGHDRPGIVRDISRVLAERGVNIEELETELTSAPDSGDALFRARARVRTPADLTPDDLRGLLESLALDLMVDLNFDEPE